MTKAKFLKTAQEKYKKACAKKFVAEMNFIFSADLILRVWFDVGYDPNNKEGDTGYRHRWCTVQTLPEQVAEQENKTTLRLLGEVTCPDEDDNSLERDMAIIEHLRNVNEDTLDESANGYEFMANGKKYEIIMWQPVEEWTLRQLTEHIGL